jgi:hypothetical protein
MKPERLDRTKKSREVSRARAPDSPALAECMDARTARPARPAGRRRVTAALRWRYRCSWSRRAQRFKADAALPGRAPLGVPAARRRCRQERGPRGVLLDPPTGFRSVEIVVRDYLAQQEGPHSTVHYVENGLINSLFGLLFWDAIFAPIPGAFFHDFQYGPADLGSGRFYERRKNQFADGFAELESSEYKATIRRRFLAFRRRSSPGGS